MDSRDAHYVFLQMRLGREKANWNGILPLQTAQLPKSGADFDQILVRFWSDFGHWLQTSCPKFGATKHPLANGKPVS